jgi:LysM repeat protein
LKPRVQSDCLNKPGGEFGIPKFDARTHYLKNPSEDSSTKSVVLPIMKGVKRIILLALFASGAATSFEYVVRSGDTLSEIALRTTGRSPYQKDTHWRALLVENPDILNSDYLIPGTKLKIPPSWWKDKIAARAGSAESSRWNVEESRITHPLAPRKKEVCQTITRNVSANEPGPPTKNFNAMRLK